MTTMIECTEGHYEVQKVAYGEVYVWCPECVVVECDCGRRLVLKTSKTVCQCGADHASFVTETLASQGRSSEKPHPLEIEYQEWRKRLDEYLRSEDTYQRELNALD